MKNDVDSDSDDGSYVGWWVESVTWNKSGCFSAWKTPYLAFLNIITLLYSSDAKGTKINLVSYKSCFVILLSSELHSLLSLIRNDHFFDNQKESITFAVIFNLTKFACNFNDYLSVNLIE